MFFFYIENSDHPPSSFQGNVFSFENSCWLVYILSAVLVFCTRIAYTNSSSSKNRIATNSESSQGLVIILL